MDCSSDPLNDPQGSSPPNIDPTDPTERPNRALSPNILLTSPVFTTTRVLPALSSDPIGIDLSFSSPNTARRHRPNSQIRKRGLSSNYALHNKERKIDETSSTSSRELVLKARDLLVQALSCTNSRSEQTSLLDLIEVF